MALNKFMSAFAAEASHPVTVRVAKAVLIFIIITQLLVFCVSADTTTSTININDMSYVVQDSISASHQPNSLINPFEYRYVNGYADRAYPTDVFTFSDTMLRFRFVTDSYGPTTYPFVQSFSPIITFNLPIPDGFFDDTILVFTLVTGLYTNQDQVLLTHLIDDVAVIIDDQTFYPSSSSIKTNGCYWTFAIELESDHVPSTMTISPSFKDFSSVAEDGNFPSDLWWMLQFSPIYVTGYKDLAATYAASIDTLLRNDLQPTLSNISEVQAGIYGELENLGGKIEGSVSSALTSVLDRLDNTGNAAIDAIIAQIREKVDLTIVDDLYNSITLLTDTFFGNHVGFELTFPAIQIPNIPGLIPGVTISEAYTLDFNEVLTHIPSVLITLVQVFCTFTLIVFIVKDFISTVNGVISGDNLSVMSGVSTISSHVDRSSGGDD